MGSVTDVVISAGGGGAPENVPAAVARNTSLILKLESKGVRIEINGVSSITLSYEVFAPEYNTDIGFRISDHFNVGTPTFSVACVFTDEWEDSDNKISDRADMLNALMTLVNYRELFSIETDFGEFDSILFTDIDVEESSDSVNSFNVTFSMKKIISAIITVAQVQFLYDEDSEQLVATDPVTGEQIQVQLTQFTAITEEQRSIIENIAAAIRGEY